MLACDNTTVGIGGEPGGVMRCHPRIDLDKGVFSTCGTVTTQDISDTVFNNSLHLHETFKFGTISYSDLLSGYVFYKCRAKCKTCWQD